MKMQLLSTQYTKHTELLSIQVFFTWLYQSNVKVEMIEDIKSINSELVIINAEDVYNEKYINEFIIIMKTLNDYCSNNKCEVIIDKLDDKMILLLNTNNITLNNNIYINIQNYVLTRNNNYNKIQLEIINSFDKWKRIALPNIEIKRMKKIDINNENEITNFILTTISKSLFKLIKGIKNLERVVPYFLNINEDSVIDDHLVNMIKNILSTKNKNKNKELSNTFNNILSNLIFNCYLFTLDNTTSEYNDILHNFYYKDNKIGFLPISKLPQYMNNFYSLNNVKTIFNKLEYIKNKKELINLLKEMYGVDFIIKKDKKVKYAAHYLCHNNTIVINKTFNWLVKNKLETIYIIEHEFIHHIEWLNGKYYKDDIYTQTDNDFLLEGELLAYSREIFLSVIFSNDNIINDVKTLINLNYMEWDKIVEMSSMAKNINNIIIKTKQEKLINIFNTNYNNFFNYYIDLL